MEQIDAETNLHECVMTQRAIHLLNVVHNLLSAKASDDDDA